MRFTSLETGVPAVRLRKRTPARRCFRARRDDRQLPEHVNIHLPVRRSHVSFIRSEYLVAQPASLRHAGVRTAWGWVRRNLDTALNVSYHR